MTKRRLVESLSLLLACAFMLAASAQVLYVQSDKASLLAEPKLKSAQVATLKKGDKLDVLETQKGWHKVKAAGKEGWVSQLLVAEKPPLGTVSLLASASGDISQDARRRASAQTTAAAARGMSEEDRKRLGAKEKADYTNLALMENMVIYEDELEQFVSQRK